MITRKRVPKDVACDKFYVMVKEIRADLALGRISRDKLKIHTYLRRYHLGHYSSEIVKELVLREVTPTQAECKCQFEKRKREFREKIDLKKNANYAVEHTPHIICPAKRAEDVLNEDTAISYLKSKGYIILKQYRLWK